MGVIEIMRYFIISICVLFIVNSSTKAYSQSIASAMGENLSVVQSGAADVARNPALLSMQTKKLEIGAFAGTLFYDTQNFALDVDVTIPSLPVESGPITSYAPAKHAIEGGGAFILKTGRLAFGAGLSGKSMHQESSYDLTLTISAFGVTNVIRNNGWRYEGNATGYASVSYQVYDWLSIGTQFKYNYKTEHEESENDSFTNAVLSSSEHESTTEDSSISTGSLGAIIKGSFFQIGIILISPEYSYKKFKYENEKTDYDTPSNSFSIKDSLAGQWLVTSNAGLVVGAGVDVIENLTLVAECGLRLQGSFEERILVINNKNYEEVNQDSQYKPMFLFSLGMKYRVDHGLSLACGGFGRFFSIDSKYHGTTVSSSNELDYSLLGFRFGFEKRISSIIALVFVASVERMSLSIISRETEGPVAMKFDMSEREYSFNANVGVRVFF